MSNLEFHCLASVQILTSSVSSEEPLLDCFQPQLELPRPSERNWCLVAWEQNRAELTGMRKPTHLLRAHCVDSVG